MTLHRALPVRLLLAGVAALALAGCASAPYASHLPMEAVERISADAVLRYRVPSGWIDASGESRDSRRVIWLVRGDYGASIAVQEIVLDGAAREAVGEENVCVLAALIRNAEGAGGAPPEAFTLDGRQYCAWEWAPGGVRRPVRVAVFAAGAKSFEVRAVAPTGATRGATEEVFRAQQKFLEALRW